MRFFKTNYNKLSDTELVELYRVRNDNACIGELFDRYAPLIYGVCLKYLKNPDDSKDALQQIFENLFKDLKRSSVQNFKSWIYSVTLNRCRMMLRSRQRKLKREQEAEIDVIMLMHDESHPLNEEFLNEIKNAIYELQDNQKICIEYFFLQQKSYKEIIELTGFSFDQVKSFVQNGKRNLKLLLEEKFQKIKSEL
ncbi:MAG: hypothetical protein A2275_12305 [Bacteroidetes bacterium RIFOXYA12_FULL_35_11]|nr:MAG: hypothetical protein A2X01_02360 [Bacteroidetes bacterium GWF2_35_48]OFY77863.1 MAG: hypothetical protein A2275_12305 [Bacteroidetes bacterium RIFOXYA12_FULL_35_11]OFY93906.1 MAG: hypothetical protein A2309_02625 [Bacteroidetes bacterium RIFOXYB2_FULL_35_7]OFY97968.1 MAG: hypothetical protein A2491_10090 [Bacteroidetes bacterium RIFOXYC12_FULL_35_7]HBX50333.1 RNA polymerase subunit sigma-24 [Bacteroidales bacterium]